MKLAWLGFLTSLLAVTSAPAAPVTVPFVGCPSDGQVGPDGAPRHGPVHVAVDAAAAARLAYYQSKYDRGVLAPRGWHCVNLEGSSGWFTIVSLEPIKPSDFLGRTAKPLKGPAVQFSFDYEETSGRFSIARLIARYFPDRRSFVQDIIAEGHDKASDFPKGPYRTDQLVSRKKHLVEYVTPANTKGLGTHSRLDPSDLAIHAAAGLVGSSAGEPGAMVLTARLPAEMDDLSPAIFRWAERHYEIGN